MYGSEYVPINNFIYTIASDGFFLHYFTLCAAARRSDLYLYNYHVATALNVCAHCERLGPPQKA